VNVWQPKLGLEGYNSYHFPGLVQIKSFTYIEEKRRAVFMEAISLEMLGLAWIATTPVMIQLVDLLVKIFKNFHITTSKKPNKGSN